jgi:rubrerythrin
MTVRTRHPSRIRPRLARGAKGQAGRSPQPDPTAAAPAPQARERSAGGPEDRALYRCSCGYVFEASVSASVGCPHCGDAQAW